MNGLLDWLTSLPSGWVYLAVALLVLTEDALFVGFIVPGETAAILGGVTASTGHTSLPVMTVVVVVAAIIGDSVGYEIGHRYGVRGLLIMPLRRHRDRLEKARNFLAEHGGPSVFLGRFVAFLRSAVPFLAGTASMPYRTFFIYNAIGGLIWGVASVLLGYLSGAAYQTVASRFGEFTALAVAVTVVIAYVVVRVRRRREQR